MISQTWSPLLPENNMTSITAQKENAPRNVPGDKSFNPSELKMMLGQCLKLASENKITPQNTWGLPLIEHLPELIREERPGDQTNFQKASVTLAAGVKIYSYRVDSVHTETFKILGGLGRASGPNERGDNEQEDDGDGTNSPTKRRRRAELNPEATLEPTLEALNIKKFDLAFAVDPLFHKTSAQFDEGGAKGLLLANLSVYRGCEIVFDSMDVPEKAGEEAATMSSQINDIDLSCIQPQLQAIRNNFKGTERLSPALDEILGLLNKAPPPGAAAEAHAFVNKIASGAPPPQVLLSQLTLNSGAEVSGDEGEKLLMEAEREAVSSYEPEYDSYADTFDGGVDGYTEEEAGTVSHARAGHNSYSSSATLDEEAMQWLMAAGNTGLSNVVTGAKGWAGATHWKYRAIAHPPGVHKNADEDDDDEGESRTSRSSKAKNKKNQPIDFVERMQGPEPQFALLAKGRGIRRTKKAIAKTLLPEDHHYAPENLARYSLRPRNAVSLCGWGDAQRQGRVCDVDVGGDETGECGFYGAGDDAEDGGWLDAPMPGDGFELVEAARKVEHVEVSYSRAAKQVDVRSLKELMWSGLTEINESEHEFIQLQEVLGTVPEQNEAGRVDDLSVHLCFICMLHLANEHGLVIQGVESLDNLYISNVPSTAT